MINLDTFKGAIPQAAGKRLPEGFAWRADHCDLTDGSIRCGKFIDDGTAGQPDISSFYTSPLTIYPIKRYKFLEWNQVVSVSLSPILNNTNRRVIYVEPGAAPKQTDASLATSGAMPYPSAWYYLGVPAPTGSFGVSVVGGSGSTETRAYVYTYVTAWGEEGLPSDPQVVSGFINGTWAVTGTRTSGPGVGYNIVKKRIYRVVTGTATATYLFVAEIDIGQAEYSDTLLTTQLGEAIPSADWFPPPSNLKQIVVTPTGICVGHDGSSIFASEPNVPHAWPYQLPVDTPIAGLQVFGDRVFVATYGNPYVLSGLTPDQFVLNKLSAIGSNRMAIPPVGNSVTVYYHTNKALLSVSDSGQENLSNKYFHPHQGLYQVNKAAFIEDALVIQDATEIITSNTAGKRERFARPFALDGISAGDGVISLPQWSGISAYCDDQRRLNPGTEDLFAAQNGKIRAILKPVEGRYLNAMHPYVWRGKLNMTARPKTYTVLKVEAEFRDLSNDMQARDADIEQNLRLLKYLRGREKLAKGEYIGAASYGDLEYGAQDYGGSSFAIAHSTPRTNFTGNDGEAINTSSLTPTEIDTPVLSGDADEYGGVEYGGIDYAGQAVTLSYATITTAAPRFREPYLKVRIYADADKARGTNYLESQDDKESRTLVHEDFVTSDRIYRFNDEKTKSDCWQIEVEGLIPCYRVTICETPEELEAV